MAFGGVRGALNTIALDGNLVAIELPTADAIRDRPRGDSLKSIVKGGRAWPKNMI